MSIPGPAYTSVAGAGPGMEMKGERVKQIQPDIPCLVCGEDTVLIHWGYRPTMECSTCTWAVAGVYGAGGQSVFDIDTEDPWQSAIPKIKEVPVE